MSTEKAVIVLMISVVGILGTGITIYDITASETSPVAKFSSASIVGPDFGAEGIPKIKAGEYAIITLVPEKTSQEPINDLMVKSYFEDPDTNKFLFIDGRKIHPGVNEKNLDIIGDKIMIQVDQFDTTGKTEPVLIKVIATDYPYKELQATVNVVLYADGKEMDKESFDLIVSPRF